MRGLDVDNLVKIDFSTKEMLIPEPGVSSTLSGEVKPVVRA